MREKMVCSVCKTENPAKAMHCLNCGHDLREGMTSKSRTYFITPPELEDIESESSGKAYFSRDAKLVLHLTDAGESIEIDVQKSITLGRLVEDQAPNSEHYDLSRFNAKEHGVSRVHVRITRLNATLVLEDLGALNGTMINGERISPIKPQVLCHSDELLLGTLAIQINFKKA